jgi:hypothetical protein
MKFKIYHTVRTVSKSNRKIVETEGTGIDSLNTHIPVLSLIWLGEGTSMERNDAVKLVL